MAAFQSELWTKLLRCGGKTRDGVWGEETKTLPGCAVVTAEQQQKRQNTFREKLGIIHLVRVSHKVRKCHLSPWRSWLLPQRDSGEGRGGCGRMRSLAGGRSDAQVWSCHCNTHLGLALVSLWLCSEDKSKLQSLNVKRSVIAEDSKCFTSSSTYFFLACHTHGWNATHRLGSRCNISESLEGLSVHSSITPFSCTRQVILTFPTSGLSAWGQLYFRQKTTSFKQNICFPQQRISSM